MKKHSLDPLIKDTAFPNNQCTSMHGISTITWCQSLRLLMYVCAQHIIFPCNPLLCFLPLCLRAGISLVKGSNCKADYFTAWDMTWSDLKGKLIQICSNNLSQETSKENGILYHLAFDYAPPLRPWHCWSPSWFEEHEIEGHEDLQEWGR